MGNRERARKRAKLIGPSARTQLLALPAICIALLGTVSANYYYYEEECWWSPLGIKLGCNDVRHDHHPNVGVAHWHYSDTNYFCDNTNDRLFNKDGS